MTDSRNGSSAGSAELIQFAAHMARLLYNDATLDDCTEEQKRAWLSAAKALMTIYDIRTRDDAQSVQVTALIELPEYLDYLEQSLVDLDLDLKLPENMQSPCVWADRVRAVLASQPSPAATVDCVTATIRRAPELLDAAEAALSRCSAATGDALTELEQQFTHVLDGWEEDSSSPAAISAIQYALGAVRDAMHRHHTAAPQAAPELRLAASRIADIITMLDAPDAYNREYIADVCRSVLSSLSRPESK